MSPNQMFFPQCKIQVNLIAQTWKQLSRRKLQGYIIFSISVKLFFLLFFPRKKSIPPKRSNSRFLSSYTEVKVSTFLLCQLHFFSCSSRGSMVGMNARSSRMMLTFFFLNTIKKIFLRIKMGVSFILLSEPHESKPTLLYRSCIITRSYKRTSLYFDNINNIKILP